MKNAPRVVGYPAAEAFELSRQLRMVIRCSQQIVHDCDRKNPDRDGGTARHRGFEDMLGIVDLLNSDDCYCVTAERCRISTIAVQQSHGKDANSQPGRDCDQKEAAGLDEKTDDSDRCRYANDGCNQSKDGLLKNLPSGWLREDRHRYRSRRRCFQLKPETYVERQYDRQPDPDREGPGTSRQSHKDRRLSVYRGAHGTLRPLENWKWYSFGAWALWEATSRGKPTRTAHRRLFLEIAGTPGAYK